jgi:hypothetical protein
MIEVASKDPSKFHFYVSLVKSAVRIVAGGAFIVGGYYLENWGTYIMAGGALLVIAEVLGILEEL